MCSIHFLVGGRNEVGVGLGGAGGGGIGLEGVLLAWVVLPFSGGTERCRGQ